ncbi:hypothetical protein CRG98_011813 [Punica granatum]|uniref:Uncharacterized protein n=1 Tax=Punica granatum TaxID=22663 RepID=A0A2I0KHX9_PUNGR|nr:hypothetical protein CRG98_011813 [Punica granatum]
MIISFSSTATTGDIVSYRESIVKEQSIVTPSMHQQDHLLSPLPDLPELSFLRSHCPLSKPHYSGFFRAPLVRSTVLSHCWPPFILGCLFVKSQLKHKRNSRYALAIGVVAPDLGDPDRPPANGVMAHFSCFAGPAQIIRPNAPSLAQRSSGRFLLQAGFLIRISKKFHRKAGTPHDQVPLQELSSSPLFPIQPISDSDQSESLGRIGPVSTPFWSINSRICINKAPD